MDQELRQLISGDIDDTAETRQKYSRDASLFEVTPEAVIHPRTVEDIQNAIHHITRRKHEGANVSLTARNGGTCMSGGSLTESYILDMSRYFNSISEVNQEEKTVWVQGGVMHRDVEKATHPLNLYFPPYTSSHDICGVGGMIGNNASGEKSVKYGPTSSNVHEIKVVLSNGEHCTFKPLTREEVEQKKQEYTLEGHIYRTMTQLLDENQELLKRRHPRVKKNAAGYPLWELWNEDRTILNLARLFIGSQGTLGIVTDAKLELVPFAKSTRMIVVPISDLGDLAATVQTMMKFDPETCETFDRVTYDLAKTYYPEDAARAHIAEGQHIVIFAMYPGESQEEADQKAASAKTALEQLGRTVEWVEDSAAIESFLLIRRKSFMMLLQHPHANSRALPFLEDTIVPIDHYGEFLAALEVILAEYDMQATYAGHIGDGSIRLIPLANVESPDIGEKIFELGQRVYDLVFAFGGSMSVDHNDGLIRTVFLERMYGKEMAALFQRVKELFDPMLIFNPGKKIGGSEEYSKQHLIRTNT